jgi:signal transduction histidine kinase
MADLIKETELPLETLSMLKVLEGLIHNINTPLNVIIGYSQQLKKQHPEIKYLESITEAGLQIDDLIQASSRQVAERFNGTETRIKVKKWLQEELVLLKNYLDVKHSIRFETRFSEQELEAVTNPFLLGICLESLVLYTRKAPELAAGNNVIVFSTEGSEKGIIISMLLPESEFLKEKLTDYMERLKTEMAQCFETDTSTSLPFQAEFDNERKVEIRLPINII